MYTETDTCPNADTPHPTEFHPRATTVAKSSCEEHKHSGPTPPLMKPDHNNEPLWLTSLRHNKQRFDMVLNIPFHPTHTLTNKHCTPLCHAQQASCDGALLASYLPDVNNRANNGCRRGVTIGHTAEVTLVQAGNDKSLLLVAAPAIEALNISQVPTCCFGVVLPTVCCVTHTLSFLYRRQWYVWTAKGQPI